ncbi:formyltetrahydrofolate deformylase [Vitiosangium sp. GDMCC 1.1324]|uniref:formyltetrahydrofolate deformylase n=1 Tax=Vitiosangium sp. (strain GDMCC 1.1324) TaxID=2138576 RepID=UPI0018EE5C21|nr:formyltetrahydrofolate deformylase [Vitiosangium sp. GDMCC 1.1324]
MESPSQTNADRARLLITCADRPGVVAAVSQLLYEQGANVVDSDQHTEPDDLRFFMRLEFDLPGLSERLPALEQAFRPVAERFGMQWQLTPAARVKRMAVFVSKQDHCLQELLWLWKKGELAAHIPLVVSNHPDAREVVAPFGVPYHHVPVTAATKAEAEATVLELMKAHQVDLIVLARYMQILSADFIERFGRPVINIHHSFLPAFVGANPYAQAHARGVKLIGATAHYVTAELDAGPIIDQDVHRVGHRDAVADLVRIGRRVERTVLARAVAWHLEDRVLLHGNKTVVFA